MTLILPAWLITRAGESPRADWGIRVEGRTVESVAPHAELRSTYPDDEVVVAPGSALLPGFVNAHVHLYGTLAHGIPVDDAPADFWSFLDDYWWPKVEDALDIDMIVAATDYVCAEMLRSGTTTFYDILEAPNAIPDALTAQREIVERRGMRGVLSFEATERAGDAVARRGLEENTGLIDACDPDGLVSGLMCWHTTFTCSDDFITEAFGLATDRGVLSHAHVNEGVHEGVWCEQRHGHGTIEHYDTLGVAGREFIASQCVQISERDRALLAERGVKVTHMPLANCEVGGGIAPIPELLDAGVTVGLGSDGYLNDFFAVMRGAFLIHKARLQDPGVLPAGQVLHMATEGGARALGLERIGRLERGWAADLQLVDLDLPTPITPHNLAEQLVLWRDGRHVSDVMVDGVWRVRHGQVLDADLDDMRMRMREQATRLWGTE